MVSSFKTDMPKLMQASLTTMDNDVIQENDSYFTGISFYDKWYLSHVKMKAKLELYLEKFREAHLTRIKNRLRRQSDTKLYYLASKSVPES